MLARRLGQTSRLGALLDPVADKLLIASSLVLLSSPVVAPVDFRIPIQMVACVYGKDFILAAGFVFLL